MTEIIVAVITGIATVAAVLEDKIKSEQHIDTDLCGWSCD